MQRDLEIIVPFHGIDDVESGSPIRRRALEIVALHDATRLDNHGGYPSECCFIGNIIVIATVEGTSEPQLVCRPVAEFVAEYSEDMDEASAA